MGIELVVLILVAIWLGTTLDKYFQTQNHMYFLIIFIGSLLGWFIRIIYLLKK